MGSLSRRGWVLFGAMGVIWGIPYLLIKVAVKQVEPAVVVFGRTVLAAVVLVLLAARAGALRPAMRHWRWVLLFAIVEMAIPWILLTNAEKQLPSGITGLLVACVPLVGSVVAYVLGDRHALHRTRVFAILLGMAGVGLLVGRDLGDGGSIPWLSVLAVMVVCVCYASAPFLLVRQLAGVPQLGVIALSLSAVAIIYAPLAWIARPEHTPRASAIWAILGLAVVCTGIAFVVFFALVSEVGPARATLITFVNPAVAVAAGAIFLDERITGTTLVGFALVLTACALATRRPPEAAIDAAERTLVLEES